MQRATPHRLFTYQAFPQLGFWHAALWEFTVANASLTRFGLTEPVHDMGCAGDRQLPCSMELRGCGKRYAATHHSNRLESPLVNKARVQRGLRLFTRCRSVQALPGCPLLFAAPVLSSPLLSFVCFFSSPAPSTVHSLTIIWCCCCFLAFRFRLGTKTPTSHGHFLIPPRSLPRWLSVFDISSSKPFLHLFLRSGIRRVDPLSFFFLCSFGPFLSVGCLE